MYLIGSFMSGLLYTQPTAVIDVNIDIGFMGRFESNHSVRIRTKKRTGKKQSVSGSFAS